MRATTKRIGFFLVTLLTLWLGTDTETGAQTPEIPTLEIRDDGLSAGYVTLGWRDTYGAVELQLNKGDAWETVYQGTDTASTFSGLANGTYIFRIRRMSGEWGEPLSIVVQHHEFSRALTYFSLGALLFLILVGVLFTGLKSANKKNQ